MPLGVMAGEEGRVHDNKHSFGISALLAIDMGDFSTRKLCFGCWFVETLEFDFWILGCVCVFVKFGICFRDPVLRYRDTVEQTCREGNDLHL